MRGGKTVGRGKTRGPEVKKKKLKKLKGAGQPFFFCFSKRKDCDGNNAGSHKEDNRGLLGE